MWFVIFRLYHGDRSRKTLKEESPMRHSVLAKASLHETHKPLAAPAWPGASSALLKETIPTALEIQFRGVENLIRALDGLTWTRGRRRR
jgi:hypothetical protein